MRVSQIVSASNWHYAIGESILFSARRVLLQSFAGPAARRRDRWPRRLGTYFPVSNTDLNDGAITGGEFDRWSVGANWYPTERWRLEVNYGQGTLDRFGIIGDTEFLQFRLQWLM